MTQHDRDFQKVLQALTVFDKKISFLESAVRELCKATVESATSQQELNKSQAELTMELGENILHKPLFLTILHFKVKIF